MPSFCSFARGDGSEEAPVCRTGVAPFNGAYPEPICTSRGGAEIGVPAGTRNRWLPLPLVFWSFLQMVMDPNSSTPKRRGERGATGCRPIVCCCFRGLTWSRTSGFSMRLVIRRRSRWRRGSCGRWRGMRRNPAVGGSRCSGILASRGLTKTVDPVTTVSSPERCMMLLSMLRSS